MVLQKSVCYDSHLLPILRFLSCQKRQRLMNRTFCIRNLRTASEQYLKFFDQNTCSSTLSNHFRTFALQKKNNHSHKNQNGQLCDERILFGAQKRGLEETMAVFQTGRKKRVVKWLFSVSFIWLTYEFLKVIYSINSLLSFPPPPAPIFEFFNRWKWLVPKASKLTFSDVIGAEDAKRELRVVIHALTSPESFSRLGAHPPRGVLLVGPPGIGKTLLGRAVAGEAKVTFLQANGSEFDGSRVGDGARRIRELFALARSRAPAIIFIDGVDSVCPRRVDVPNEPSETLTTNQLLVEMDGLLAENKQKDVVVVLGATNREDLLDPAALRGGRFGTQIHLRPPEYEDRVKMLLKYLDRVNHTPISPPLLEELAKRSAGMTGADIANVVNRAAIQAGLAKSEYVTDDHLLAALDQLQWGLERKIGFDTVTRYSRAVHEAGHAVLARFTKEAPQLYRVSIQSSSDDGHGQTCFAPDETDRPLTQKQLLARLDVLLGGRMAEEELLGRDNVSLDAAVDLQKASRIAIDMVRRYGMSARIGFRSLPMPTSVDSEGELEDSGNPFSQVSSSLEDQADAEVARLLSESCTRARIVIRTKLKELKRVVDALENYGTLDADDLSAVLIGGVPKAGVQRETEAERNISRWSVF